MSGSVQTPVQLYRHLLRVIKSLPKSMQGHYKHHVKQQYKSHSDEIDPERIKQIIDKSVEDAEWIVKKMEEVRRYPNVQKISIKLLGRKIDLVIADGKFYFKKGRVAESYPLIRSR